MEDNLTEMFLNFEEERQLFSRSIHNIKYWQMIRFELFEEVQKEKLNHGDHHPDLQKNKKASVKSALQLLKNSVGYSNNWSTIKGKILLSAACRKRSCQSELLLKMYKGDMVFLDRPYNFGHLLRNEKYDFVYPDLIELIRGGAIVFSNRLPFIKKRVREEIRDWVADLNNTFQTSIDLDFICGRVTYSIVSFIILNRYFYKHLKKNKPRLILITPYYENFNLALIHTAKRMGIKTVELQHGYISKDHLAYNYKTLHNEYLPDAFIMFGEYWRDAILFPDKKRIYIGGSIELEQELKLQKKDESQEPDNQVFMVVSQAAYADVLYPFAVELADLLEKQGRPYKIIYKLHPSEGISWKELHPDYQDSRIVFSCDNIYNVINEASVQIGINSTAIFEGAAFGLKTFIIDCKYLKEGDMSQFCDKGFASLVSSAKDVVCGLDTDNNPLDTDYIWGKNASDQVRQIIKKLDSNLPAV